jgi:Fe-Mn family superoxide dismutase
MKIFQSTLYLTAILFFIASCQPGQVEQESQATDVSEKTGVDYGITMNLPDNAMAYPYQQKELGYAYDGLEPYFDEATMEVHYSKHHAGYTAKFNKAVEENNLSDKQIFEIFANISDYPDAVRNNGGGYYNHLLFWQILTPGPISQPSGELSASINEAFGNYDAFIDRFNTAAKTVFGSGWAWLSVNEQGKLFISQTSNQDNPLMDVTPERGIPILCLDVWEHAYYLKFKNKRGEFIENFWNVVNWPEVERRYAEAVQAIG